MIGRGEGGREFGKAVQEVGKLALHLGNRGVENTTAVSLRIYIHILTYSCLYIMLLFLNVSE